MISTIAIENQYIEALKNTMGDSKTIECLMVAHSDPTLFGQLEAAFAEASAALLQVPQGSWELRDGDLMEAIKWAIEECRVKRIVLIGDSSASVPDCGANFQGTMYRGLRNLELIDRARRVQGLRQRVQDHFAGQLQILLESTEIASRLANGELIVNGLFYRSEAGVFAIYDERAESFALLN